MSLDNDQIIQLTPVTKTDGHIVYVEQATPEPDLNEIMSIMNDNESGVDPSRAVVLAAGGQLFTADANDHRQHVSVVPQDRLSANDPDFNALFRRLRQGENGQPGNDQVMVNPGGGVELVPKNGETRQLSVVPDGRMAAETFDAEIDRLNCRKAENWTRIDHPVIPGWSFSLRPFGDVGTCFKFYAFDPGGGRLYLSPIDPVFDTLLGHESHVITLKVGTESMPIVCKAPNDYDFQNITTLRGTAAKFALYHAARIHFGETPFSA